MKVLGGFNSRSLAERGCVEDGSTPLKVLR